MLSRCSTLDWDRVSSGISDFLSPMIGTFPTVIETVIENLVSQKLKDEKNKDSDNETKTIFW